MFKSHLEDFDEMCHANIAIGTQQSNTKGAMIDTSGVI